MNRKWLNSNHPWPKYYIPFRIYKRKQIIFFFEIRIRELKFENNLRLVSFLHIFSFHYTFTREFVYYRVRIFFFILRIINKMCFMIRFENFVLFSGISPEIHIRFTESPNEILLFRWYIYCVTLKIIASQELSRLTWLNAQHKKTNYYTKVHNKTYIYVIRICNVYCVYILQNYRISFTIHRVNIIFIGQ